MVFERAEYPQGLKPGDFIQTVKHFGDIFFEVTHCYCSEDGRYWSIDYVTYDKYGSEPRRESANSVTQIRRVLPAELAIPVIRFKGERFNALAGQYDPFYGYAPRGTPLRRKED